MAKKFKTSKTTGEGLEQQFDDGSSTFTRFTKKPLGANFQHLANATTGKIIGVGKDANLQDLANSGFNPIANDDPIFRKNDIIGELGLKDKSGGVNGSDNVRGDRARFENEFNNLRGSLDTTNLDGLNTFGQSAVGKERLAALDQQQRNLGNFSQQQQGTIRSAGESAGSRFDPLIQQAQESARQGKPKAKIGAGEIGGFMNTQFAGAAALNTVAGDTFAGAGGEIERINSAFDLNISNIQAQKQSAILQAEQAAKTAIRTGKQQDLSAATNLFGIAKQLFDDENNLVFKKVDAISKLQSQSMAEKIGLQNLDINDAKIKEQERSIASDQLTNSINGGIPASDFDVENKSAFESKLGIPAGSFDKYYENVVKINELAQAGDKLEVASSVADILKDIPVGSKVNILGKEYEGLKGKTSSDTTEYKNWLLRGSPGGTFDQFLRTKKYNENGLPDNTQSQIDSLAEAFDRNGVVKKFIEAHDKKESFDSIIANGNGGPADLALVFEFMKALDPQSVVRETEFATAAKSGNIFKGWAARFNGYLEEEGGFLPENVKKEFQNIVNQKFDVSRKNYTNIWSETGRKINIKLAPHQFSNGTEYLTQYDLSSNNEDPNEIKDTSSIFINFKQ